MSSGLPQVFSLSLATFFHFFFQLERQLVWTRAQSLTSLRSQRLKKKWNLFMSLVSEGNFGDNHNRVSVSDADTVLSFSHCWDVQVQEAVNVAHPPRPLAVAQHLAAGS